MCKILLMECALQQGDNIVSGVASRAGTTKLVVNMERKGDGGLRGGAAWGMEGYMEKEKVTLE